MRTTVALRTLCVFERYAMISAGVTESVVEQAGLAWLESVGWEVRNGTEIAPGEPTAERDDYGHLVLTQRLRNSLLPFVAGDPPADDDENLIGRAV